MKKLIKQFNTSGTRLVISDWPEKTKKGEKNYGIAWYTKEILEPLAQEYGQRFVVLAERAIDNSPKTYCNGKILVLRVFDQKHPTLFPRILTWLSIFNRIKRVDIHSEFCTNGGVKNFILLLPFMLLIKLAGKHITYFSHNVVTSLTSIAPHLGYNPKSIQINVLNIGLKLFYKFLGIIVDRFVVMDEVIQKRLCLFVDPKKVYLFPFWTDQKPGNFSRKKARALLGIKEKETLLLYFGFITYYKGADWLVRTVKSLKRQRKLLNVKLILAGGEAYSLKEKAYYKKFYLDLVDSVAFNKNILITGFIPEQDIEKYFKASDVVVFPYRGLIGSSAVLSHAFNYKKPFILSRGMGEVLKNKGIKDSFKRSGLFTDDIIFDWSEKSFGKALRFATSRKTSKHFSAALNGIAESRKKSNLLEDCYTQLYANKESRFFGQPALSSAR